MEIDKFAVALVLNEKLELGVATKQKVEKNKYENNKKKSQVLDSSSLVTRPKLCFRHGFTCVQKRTSVFKCKR